MGVETSFVCYDVVDMMLIFLSVISFLEETIFRQVFKQLLVDVMITSLYIHCAATMPAS